VVVDDVRFWRAVDEACDAKGVLLTAYMELDTAKVKHEQNEREQRLAAVRAEVAELRGRADGGNERPLLAPCDHVRDSGRFGTPRFLPDVVSRLSQALLAAGLRQRTAAAEPAADVTQQAPDLRALAARVTRAWQLRQLGTRFRGTQ